ncbi:MAG: VTT domain-containing protein, partial [Wenzhouxiangella sp.]
KLVTMENGLIGQVLELIEARPLWLVLAAFAFAFLESLAIVGLVVPGILLLFLVGAVVGFDPALFIWVWLAASLGALSGDLASYWVGRHFRDRIPQLWPFYKRPELLASGQQLFARHGGKSLLMGRFIGPMRPVVPMLAGTMGLRRLVFLGFAIPACLLWAPLYLLPGMLFGASLDLAAELAGRLVLLLVLAVLGVWFVAWVTRIVYEFTARRSGWWLKSLVRWAHRHPLAGRVVGDLFEPGRHQVISIALLGLLLMIALVLLASALIIAPFTLPAWDAELQIMGLAASLRSHLADPLFVVLVLAGDAQVLGLLAGTVAVMLLLQRRRHALRHWIVAIGGGWLLATGTAFLMGFVVATDATGSGLDEVPHRALTLATLIFGFFAVMVAKDLGARRRKWPYLASSVTLAALGFAQFYLGQASLIGLLAAFALGLGWLALIGIAYRMRARPRTHPVWFAAVLTSAFVLIAAVHVQAGFDDKLSASRLALPERQLERRAWLESEWQHLPQRRSRLGSYQQQRFDLQLEADLDALENALLARAWHRPPTAGLLSLLTRLAADAPADAPTLPRDFAGRPEDLVLFLAVDEDSHVALRLWDSGARMVPGGSGLWLGQARVLRLEPGWLGLQAWKEVPGTRPIALAILLQALPELQALEKSDGTVLLSPRSRSGPQPARPAASGLQGAAEGR